MEAHSYRKQVIPCSRNICFVYKALADKPRCFYDLDIGRMGTIWFPARKVAAKFGFCGIARLVVSMDRLLRYFLQQFICRGAITFSTAGGEKFTCGDGTGPHIFARFLTADAERRVLLNPELALGEIYMEGSFVVEEGSIADALSILMDQPEILPRWADRK